MFTLQFSQVFPSLPMGLHKPTFQKRQTSSATSSCIFYLIPNVQKATLPKASVHKGDREALQKSILFEYRESLSHSLPGGFLEGSGHAASFYPHALLLFPLAALLGGHSLPPAWPTAPTHSPPLRYPVTGAVPAVPHPLFSRSFAWLLPPGYPGVWKGRATFPCL